jgi:hypothetical protein
MLKSFSGLRRNYCAHLVEKKIRLKKTTIAHSQNLSVVDMQKHFLFFSSFEHVNFKINKKYSRINYDNPNYYASLMIFQTYKNTILSSIQYVNDNPNY